jgi:hypothetical protein
MRMTEKESLKMFVWNNVLTDYTSGMICVLAHNIEEARDVIAHDREWGIITRADGSVYVGPLVCETEHTDPVVYDVPTVVHVWGGG